MTTLTLEERVERMERYTDIANKGEGKIARDVWYDIEDDVVQKIADETDKFMTADGLDYEIDNSTLATNTVHGIAYELETLREDLEKGFYDKPSLLDRLIGKFKRMTR